MRIKLYKNDYKQADKHPDYKLSFKDGDEWVSVGAAWVDDNGLYIQIDDEGYQRYQEYKMTEQSVATDDSKADDAEDEDDNLPF